MLTKEIRLLYISFIYLLDMFFCLFVNLACYIFSFFFSLFESCRGMGRTSFYGHFYIFNFVDFVRKGHFTVAVLVPYTSSECVAEVS